MLSSKLSRLSRTKSQNFTEFKGKILDAQTKKVLVFATITIKGIRRAHKIHHKNIHKEEGECFGMLWVPKKYFR